MVANEDPTHIVPVTKRDSTVAVVVLGDSDGPMAGAVVEALPVEARVVAIRFELCESFFDLQLNLMGKLLEVRPELGVKDARLDTPRSATSCAS